MDLFSLYLLALKIGAAAMVSLWVVSIGRHDASVVDLWWGPGFAVAALVVWLTAGASTETRPLIALALVAAWSVRLTRLMVRRRRAHPGEDPRYTELRDAWGAGFWWKSLFIVFLLQAVLQWVVALAPMAAVSVAPGPIGPVGLLGAAIALGGLALETVADAQLDAHRRAGGGGLLTTGLRGVVRFPNYLGEIVVWTGLWLIAAEAGAWWWAVASPLLIAALLIKVSGAPVLDARFADRPGYARWRAETPAFLPRPLSRLVGRARRRT